MARDADELERLIDAWFEREVDRQWQLFAGGDFARALQPEGSDEDEKHELNRRWFAADAERTIEVLASDYARGRFEIARPEARAIAAGLSSPLPEDGQRFAVLCKQVMEARGEIEEARIRWAEGAIEHRPIRPGTAGAATATAEVASGEAATTPDPPPGRTLGEAIDLYLDLQRRRTNATERGVTQRRGELRVLTDALGADMPVAAVTRPMAGRIYEALQFLPKNFRKSPQLARRPFFDMVEAARGLDLEPLNGRTINGYLSTMRALFDLERLTKPSLVRWGGHGPAPRSR